MMALETWRQWWRMPTKTEDVELSYSYGVNRYCSIDTKPPLPTRDKVTLKPGDIVMWKNPPWPSSNDNVGTVIHTRWTLMDWTNKADNNDGKFYPEAQIMWSNGCFTNTHQQAVKKVNMNENKPVRDFDDSEGRKKSPAAPKKKKDSVNPEKTDYIENAKDGCQLSESSEAQQHPAVMGERK